MLVFMIACEENPSNDPDILYFNSFESESDIVEFEGIPVLSDKSAPGCGDKSLYISGGCEVPHALVEIGPWRRSETLKLDFMGKAANSGLISMYQSDDPQNRIEVQVNDFFWHHYKSSESLVVPGKSTVTIEFFCGGIAFDEMWIDDFKVTRD